VDERKARVTALRYFGGLTHDEIAMACSIHVNTVSRELHLGEAWLRGRFET
jgi:DNA-directed RNA polymerase specialized sigma24 family protein